MKAHLSVVSCATVMVLVFATVSACTGPPSSSHPDVGTGTGTTSGTGTGTSTATHTSDATAESQAATGPATNTTTSTATATATTATATATTATPTTQPPTPTPTPPQGAPETGGGGTAGLQDGLAIGAGLAAILAGLGSLAYRRRLTRRRR